MQDLKKPHIVHSCSLDRTVVSFDLKAERKVNYHAANNAGGFTSMAQRRDSELELVTVSTDGLILSWDCDEADPVNAILDPSRLKLSSAAVSPSGRYLMVCGDE